VSAAPSSQAPVSVRRAPLTRLPTDTRVRERNTRAPASAGFRDARPADVQRGPRGVTIGSERRTVIGARHSFGFDVRGRDHGRAHDFPRAVIATRFHHRPYRAYSHFGIYGSYAYAYPRICYPHLSYFDYPSSYVSIASDVVRYEPSYYEPVSPIYVAPAPPVVGVAPEESSAASEALDRDTEEGLAAFTAGRYDEARRLFMRAILDDPENAYAVVMYGLTDFALGSYGAAADGVRRGVRSDPLMIDSPPDIGAVYGQSSDLERHISELEQYIAAHPAEADGHLLLGFVHYGSGDPQQAAAAFERAVQLDPDDSVAYLLRDAARTVSGGPRHSDVPASEPSQP
jgi:hypothetical protein